MTDKKNLLIITSSNFPYGSASANLLRLMGQGLRLHQWQVDVLVQRGLHIEGKKEIPSRCGSVGDVSYRFCGWRIRPGNILLKQLDTCVGNLVACGSILHRKIKGRIDDVLVYNNSGMETAGILLLCKILHIPAVTYISEWYERESVVRRWYHIAKWWDFLFRMKVVNPRYDGLVMPSHFLFKYYKTEKHIPESRLYILPNLVDLTFFEAPEVDREFPKQGIRIGYCGTPTRKDGAEDLLRAFQVVHAQHPSSELMIIGDSVGEAALLPNLKQLAVELGVQENVIFTGLVPFSRMPGLLHSCDILALARPAGIFAEAGFPTKLGEYMACKKPVVLTRVGDMPRYLSHQENAMLAEPDNPADFAEQILWLIDHPVASDEIAAAGCQWATRTLSHRDATAAFSSFLMKFG